MRMDESGAFRYRVSAEQSTYQGVPLFLHVFGHRCRLLTELMCGFYMKDADIHLFRGDPEVFSRLGSYPLLRSSTRRRARGLTIFGCNALSQEEPALALEVSVSFLFPRSHDGTFWPRPSGQAVAAAPSGQSLPRKRSNPRRFGCQSYGCKSILFGIPPSYSCWTSRNRRFSISSIPFINSIA